MSALFDIVDTLPGWAFVGLVITVYGAMGLLLTLLDEWDRRAK